MMKIKWSIILAVILMAALAIFYVLSSDHAVVFHPKGEIAHKELTLIKTNVFLMLLIILPTLFWLLHTAWKYRSKNRAAYDPEHTYGAVGEALLWIVPSIVVLVMALITWSATHELDPYKPIPSDEKKLTIQVVALDWKWLFLYPEQGIATVNFVQFPEKIPIRFELAADGSPMNSFWIPQLSGQIYAMTGMVTTLYLIADGPHEYPGKAVEINGEGYADMTFLAKSTSSTDFNNWVEQVRQSPLRLTLSAYDELVKPSIAHPVTLYSQVEPGLFTKIVHKPYQTEP